MFFTFFTLLASKALAGAFNNPACASDQATSWESVKAGQKDPAWPYTCSMLYTWEEGDTLASVLDLFDREAYEIFIWNCFLNWEVNIKIPSQICIEAELPPESHTLSHFGTPTLAATTTTTADTAAPATETRLYV